MTHIPAGTIPSIEVDPAMAEMVEVHPLARADRLTVLFDAHHEQLGEQPSSIHCVYAVPLNSKEVQMVRRKLKLKAELLPLDFGWMPANEAGLVVIENRTGKHLPAKPTAEEIEANSKKIVKVYISGGLDNEQPIIIRPGRFHAFDVEDPSRIRVIGENEPPVHLFIFPK